MTQRRQVLDAIAASPPLLSEGFHWISRLQDPDCDLVLAADFIRTHASLSGAMLRLANSTYFGPPRSIATVWDAILRLGTNHVFKMAMGMALYNVTRAPLHGYGLLPFDFLAHSAAVAILSEALANGMGLQIPNHLFTSALLHDVGKLPISQSLMSDGQIPDELLHSRPKDRCAVERRLFGIDHAEAGALLAEAWNLPWEIVSTIGAHHACSAGPSADPVVELIRLANELARALLYKLGHGDSQIRHAPELPCFGLKIPPHCLDRAIQSSECALHLWLDAYAADVKVDVA